MAIDFQDITIVANPQPNQVRAGHQTTTKVFPFQLSAPPPSEWQGIFLQEWAKRRNNVTPTGSVTFTGSSLNLECQIENLPLRAQSLDVDIATANQKYRAQKEQEVADKQRVAEQAAAQKQAEDRAIQDVLGKLKSR